jgi:hypothetical protein
VQIAICTRKDFKGRGGTPDISQTLMFNRCESVLYSDPFSTCSITTKRPGYFMEFADNMGDTKHPKKLNMA